MLERESEAGKPNFMKKTLTVIMLAIVSLAFTGCTRTVIKAENWSATNTSVLWTRKNLSATVSTNGTATVSETDSSPDAESIKVLAGTVAALAVKP